MDASLPALVARLAVSLAVVVALMVVVGRVLRSRSSFGRAAARGRTPPIEVLARQGFGRNASVVLVRAGGRALVIGVTDSRVTLLAEADPEALAFAAAAPEGERATPANASRAGSPTPPTAAAGASSWKATLEQMRERTTRRS